MKTRSVRQFIKWTVSCVVAISSAALVGALLTAVAPQVDSGTWTPAGTIGDIPHGAASAVLDDGRVLVAGGETDGQLLASVALYSPVDGTWTVPRPMSAARSGHTATPLADGRVLIAGGTTADGPSAGLEVYDPATGTSASAGVLALARTGHAAAALADGRVLIVGGSDGTNVLALANVYDPADGSVSPVPTTLAAPQFSFSPARDAECWYLTSRRRRPGGRLRGGRWSVALCTFLLAVS